MKPISPLLTAMLMASALLISACGQDLPPMKTSDVTELIQIDRAPGTGEVAVAGRGVSVHYTGWLYDEATPEHKGQKFDSSHDRGSPLEFTLGEGRVIKGWELGVAGMKVGGQRTLLIPPSLGYGDRGAGGVIPPNATLVFDVELVGVK